MLGLLGRKLSEALLVCIIVSFATFLLVNWTGHLAIAIGKSDGNLRLAASKHNAGLGRRTIVASYVAKVF